MWIFASIGAFMPAIRPPHTVAEGDDQVLQIRARRRADLARLRQQYMPDLGPTYRLPESDYQFRANASRAGWAAALVRMSFDIDYEKFKPTTVDDELHNAYLAVWSVLLSHLSPRRKRKGKRARPSDNWWDDAIAWRDAR